MTSTSAAPGQPPEGIGLAAFNALPAERARGLLLGCILKSRLRNGPDAERQVVRSELRTINDLRLTKLIGS